MRVKRFVSGVMAAAICISALSGAALAKGKDAGDLVVYDKIYTANGEGKEALADAMVIKDGKYIYVGDAKGAEAYIDDSTEVIDHNGKGMTMPGCTEGHGHYLQAASVISMVEQGKKIRFETEDDHAAILQKLDEMKQKVEKSGIELDYLMGSGWSFTKLRDDMPTAKEIDKYFPDIPVYLADEEGHKGIANTLCLKRAGIIDENGKIIREISGGEIAANDDGTAAGYCSEQAGTFVRKNGIPMKMTKKETMKMIKSAQSILNSMGYTAAFEGWANYWNTDAYPLAQKLDEKGDLTLNYAFCYEIDSSCEDAKAEVDEAEKLMSFESDHFKPNYIKLFMDGTPDSGTAFLHVPYKAKENGTGIQCWQPDVLNKLVSYANEKGVTVHSHAMGDAAVDEIIDAYIESNSELRNQIVHLEYVSDDAYDKMAKYGIVASAGALWHTMSDEEIENYKNTLEEPYSYSSFPIKSFLDHGVVMSLSTDAPATGGSPSDPFGIMEIAVTGKAPHIGRPTVWNPDECIGREDVLKAFTMSGAYQMSTEEERGSIEVGKYADFILIDQDVLSCDESKIHETTVEQTFFEGENVYTAE